MLHLLRIQNSLIRVASLQRQSRAIYKLSLSTCSRSNHSIRQMSHRPRNHQGRPPANRSRGGTGGYGRSRGPLPAVPTISQVVPGARVSIVLKEDQPTGREVQGSVADVLTRGDHPRGIKVRLVDGRVGRVQRMVGDGETIPDGVHESRNQDDASRVGETGGQYGSRRGRGRGGRRGGRMAHDVRLEEEELPPQTYSLADYLPAEPEPEVRPSQPQEVVVCPVCQAFEGDEAAVAHHVNEHFD